MPKKLDNFGVGSLTFKSTESLLRLRFRSVFFPGHFIDHEEREQVSGARDGKDCSRQTHDEVRSVRRLG